MKNLLLIVLVLFVVDLKANKHGIKKGKNDRKDHIYKQRLLNKEEGIKGNGVKANSQRNLTLDPLDMMDAMNGGEDKPEDEKAGDLSSALLVPVGAGAGTAIDKGSDFVEKYVKPILLGLAVGSVGGAKYAQGKRYKVFGKKAQFLQLYDVLKINNKYADKAEEKAYLIKAHLSEAEEHLNIVVEDILEQIEAKREELADIFHKNQLNEDMLVTKAQAIVKLEEHIDDD